MFILRRIDPKFGEINTNLGEYYSLISKEKNNEQFKETVNQWDEDIKDKMYGVIIFDDDSGSLMPLYRGSEYYIMTSDGRTFSNISIPN